MSDRDFLRSTFTTVADLYARARPGYPEQLFDELIELAQLPPGGRVLEIGCGTGQATRPMAERGFVMTCVELGEDMATVARSQLAAFDNVEVITSSFEDWPLPPEPFDLVMAATAFHWIAREHAASKPAAALKPGGALAVFSNEHVAGGTSEFFTLMQRCYEQFMPGTPPGLECAPDADMTPLVRELAATGLFQPAIVRKYVLEVEYDSRAYLDLLRTYSGHIALDPDNQASLFACLQDLIDNRYGGQIRKKYQTNLVLARRDVEK